MFVSLAKLLVSAIYWIFLAEMIVPDEATLLSDATLVGMDEKSKNSLNGWRVCQFILSHVPDVKVFRSVLKFVKYWAVRRLIYCNLLGYLGGVSWAILVAYVCKQNEGQSVIDVLMEVFRVLIEWNWRRPININDKANPFALFQRGNGEIYQMPIITPCVPYQISSYNITATTLDTIRTEAARAANIISSYSTFFLDALLEERDPFIDYDLFIVVIFAAPTAAALKRWKGMVESRLRQFVGLLEGINGMKRCQIVPRGFRAKDEDYAWLWAVGFDHVGGFPAVHAAVDNFQFQVLFPLMAKEGLINEQQTSVRVVFKGFRRDKLVQCLSK